MKIQLKNNLFKQLVALALIMCGIVFVSLVFFLPNLLKPVYERNLYYTLKQPLDIISTDIDNVDKDIAYIYVLANKEVIKSKNIDKVIKLPYEQLILKLNQPYGKFEYEGRYYYYYTTQNDNLKKISITNDNYIQKVKDDIILVVFPIMIITFLLIVLIIFWWGKSLVTRIEKLKNKIDNIDNDDYIDKYNYNTDDELLVLSQAIDNMRLSLKEQEEYKNSMYQNISHDFKTPLAVIKSYLEAIEDGIYDYKTGYKVINEQVLRLESKVQGLLYLNKLNYIKDLKDYKKEQIKISPIINKSIEKFKIQNKNIIFKLDINNDNITYRGNIDIWEAILDNILSNFIRYTKKIIKITVKNDKIILYNDGENIESNVLNDIFSPYKKGINGQFGLGLSIVKKSLVMLDYEVIVKNEKKGVSFIIK